MVNSTGGIETLSPRTSQTYENGDKITFAYDNNGALATVTDSATGRTTTYYYDASDRMVQYVESDGEQYNHSVRYVYDEVDNLSAMIEIVNGVTRTQSYTYDDDNRVTSVNNNGSIRNYTYDAYSRLSQQAALNSAGAAILTEVFAYKTSADGMPTGQVASQNYVAMNRDITYSYEYDDNGNIISIVETATNGKSLMPTVIAVSYEYDSLGQLVRENNDFAQRTWTWEYDNAGNILCRKEYGYTTGTLGPVIDTVNYTYGDSAWGDLLTAYDGVAIQYDTIGNPLSDGTWTYTWEHGRQLASMSDGTTTWSYTYDANGLRTSRTNGTDTYTYVYNGGQLVQMTVGSDVLDFTYDASGHPMTMTYNGVVYYYVTNIQGDVIAILNNKGAAVVGYYYDAWGNIIVASGDLAEVNPLTYRGYVYDYDTGLYYLQSRYYNPEIGRFINADIYVSTGQGIIGNNMFTYCDNNPVSNIDPNGHAKVTIIIKKDFLRDALTSSLSALGTIIGAALFSFTGAGAVIAGAIGAALGWTFGGSISRKFITKDVTLKLWLPFVKAGTYIVY